MKDYSQPDSDLAKCIDAGMDFIARAIIAHGGEPERIFVAVTVNNMDPDAAICGAGFDGPVELVAWLIQHAKKTADDFDLPLMVVPTDISPN